MTEESNSNAPEANSNSEPSTESLQTPPSPDQASANPFIPNLGVRELTATWEMLVAFKKAILHNEHWTGLDVQAVAMGLSMVSTMEGQYRIQMDMAKAREKNQAKAAQEAIKAQGGQVSGKAANLETVH